MRNSLLDRTYFNGLIEFITRAADKETCFADFKEINKDRIGTKEPFEFGVLLDVMSRSYLQAISYRYTRGDDLSAIRSEVFLVAVDNMITAFDELDRHGRLDAFYYEGHKNKYFGDKRSISASRLLTLLTELAWYYCFRVDEAKYYQISKHFVPDNICPAVDVILARHHTDRRLADNNPDKGELLSFWNEFVVADKPAQTAMLPSYLDDWARIVTVDNNDPSVSIVTPGIVLSHKHASNKTLPKEVKGKNHALYKGHWAWEVALMVVFFELDDSEIRDHPLYPVELVDYYRSTA